MGGPRERRALGQYPSFIALNGTSIETVAMPVAFKSGQVHAAGHRLYFESYGEAVRGTILCLHGGPGATCDLVRPIAALAQFGFRVVIYDQLGCGRSQKLRSYRRVTMATLADEVEAVRRGLHLGRCHLFGYSFGGALALQTVLRHPRGYRSLIVGSGYASEVEAADEVGRLVSRLPGPVRATIQDFELRGEGSTDAYQRACGVFYRRHSSRFAVTPLDLLLGLRNTNPAVGEALVGHGNLLGRATGTLAGWDVTRDLRRIRVPTLVTVGRRDFITPRCAKTIRSGIPGARLIVYERSGHAAMLEEQDLYLRNLRDFLQRVP